MDTLYRQTSFMARWADETAKLKPSVERELNSAFFIYIATGIKPKMQARTEAAFSILLRLTTLEGDTPNAPSTHVTASANDAADHSCEREAESKANDSTSTTLPSQSSPAVAPASPYINNKWEGENPASDSAETCPTTTTTNSVSSEKNKQEKSNSGCSKEKDCKGKDSKRQDSKRGDCEEKDSKGNDIREKDCKGNDCKGKGQGAPCTEQQLCEYFQQKGMANAKDQAHQCYEFNEARGWKIGHNRIKDTKGWQWIAHLWMTNAANHPLPPKAPLTTDELAEQRQQELEEQRREQRHRAIVERWNDVRNILCVKHKDEYMTHFHPITIVTESDDKVWVRIPDDVLTLASQEPYRTSILEAVRCVYGGKRLIRVTAPAK